MAYRCYVVALMARRIREDAIDARVTSHRDAARAQGKEKRSFQTQPPSITSRTAVWLRKDRTVTTAKAFRAFKFCAPTTATLSWLGGSSSPNFFATFPKPDPA